MSIQQLTKSDTAKLYALFLLTILGLLFLALSIEKGHDVLWINGHHSPALDAVFRFITNGGDGLIFVPIILVALFIRLQYAVVAVVATLFSGLLSILFKQVLFPGVPRPKSYLDNDLLYFVPGVDVHATNSFASGHAITAFCAALFITLISKNKIVAFFSLLFALMVAYSRIYLLQHFLIDIAGGAVIGCFATFGTWQIFELVRKPDWMSKRVNINLKSAQERSGSGQYNRVS